MEIIEKGNSISFLINLTSDVDLWNDIFTRFWVINRNSFLWFIDTALTVVHNIFEYDIWSWLYVIQNAVMITTMHTVNNYLNRFVRNKIQSESVLCRVDRNYIWVKCHGFLLQTVNNTFPISFSGSVKLIVWHLQYDVLMWRIQLFK